MAEMYLLITWLCVDLLFTHLNVHHELQQKGLLCIFLLQCFI